MVLKIRKSDGFRELYENEPEMTAPRLETTIRYLWHHVWWACFHDQKRFWGFREIIEFVSRIFWSLMTSRCLKEMNTLVCGSEMSMKVRTIGIRQRFGQNKLEWTGKTRWRTISTTKESTIWIGEPFRTCWKATLQRLVIKLMNTPRVFALFYFVNGDNVHNFLTVSMRSRCNDQLICGNF